MLTLAFAQFLSGLASASSLFLVASGLSIIFGVTRIVNFAHGSFYMLGAYLAYSLTARLEGGPLGWWGAVLLSALAVGVLGAALEILLLRRLYKAPELLQLLATFGVVLVVQDVALRLWGPQDLLGPRAPGLEGAIEVSGATVPLYDLFLVGLGPAVLGLLWLLFKRTRFGILVRAATQDRQMAAALGVDQNRLFTAVFFLGSLLAGLAGALQLPRSALDLHMDMGVIVEVFVVVVIGGMGSVPGAFLAAVLIGELNAFGILAFPRISLVLTFLVMAVVLVLRPRGLLGRPEATVRNGEAILLAEWDSLDPLAGARGWLITGLLASLPLVLGDYGLVVATEILVMALFAASLHLLMGPAGLTSFGHAAYFGLGAYGAALAVHHLRLPMEPALLAAVLAALAGAALYGWLCVRLSGIYFAMLTLAFAQITWSVVFQGGDVTGGDNGLLGIWPAAWASSKSAFYWLSLALVALGIRALRQVAASPFGYALRAGRDSPLRAEAVGIAVRRFQWAGFVVSGGFAGLAGGLYAFSKGSVFPDVLAIPQSVDGLVMVLMGGIESLAGPLLGAAMFTGLKAEVTRLTELWRAVLGGIILALVLAFPGGLAGALRGRRS